MVKIHAQTILPAKPQRTDDAFMVEPAPKIAPVMVWVVETGTPMAVAVIGGLVTSTLLSLLVVPALYSLIDDLEHWLGRHLKRHRPEPLPEAGA